MELSDLQTPKVRRKLKKNRKDLESQASKRPSEPLGRIRPRGKPQLEADPEPGKKAKLDFQWSDLKPWFQRVEIKDWRENFFAYTRQEETINETIEEVEAWIAEEAEPRLSSRFEAIVEDGALILGSQDDEQPKYFNVMLDIGKDTKYLLKYAHGQEDITSQLAQEIAEKEAEDELTLRLRRAKEPEQVEAKNEIEV